MASPDYAFPPIPRDTRQSAKHSLDAASPWRRLGEQLDALGASCDLENCHPDNYYPDNYYPDNYYPDNYYPDNYHPDKYNEALMDSPVLLLQKSLATFFQWIEQLTDRQAAEASRTRIEWKYALRLSLNHPGFQASTLCHFRHQLVGNPALQRIFWRVLENAYALDLWPNLRALPPSTTQLLAALCELNQTSWMSEAFAQVLQALALFQPDWLRQIALPHWYTRYAAPRAVAKPAQETPAPVPLEVVQRDIAYLFQMLARQDAVELDQLPEIRRLRWGWRYGRKPCASCQDTCVICTQCIVGASIANPELVL